MLDKLLPKFKVVEINNVAALRMGHVIAQTVAKATEVAVKPVGDYKFVENGIIVGLSKNNRLVNYVEGTHKQPCLVYTEELVTSGLISGLNQFANQVDANGEVYVRALPLNIGDTFTTNNIDGTIPEQGYAKVVNGIITIAEDATDAIFIVKKSTLPTGEEAAECIYCGK